MNVNSSRIVLLWLLCLLVPGLMAITRVGQAQLSFFIPLPLCSFVGSNGSAPFAGVIQDEKGNLYGTTISGGVYNAGTVFEITTDGLQTTLYSFGRTASDGTLPEAALILGKSGIFYGTTSSGGANNEGTVFKITPFGTLTTLHSFSALHNGINTDGANPEAALIQGRDGNFYGTTSSGGANNEGTVFKITPSGKLTTLHSFSALNIYGINTDGAFPVAGLLQGKDGKLYGTTYGGGAYGYGTIFTITPSGTPTTLYSFSGYNSSIPDASDGANPHAGLIQGQDGNFYGTTSSGGANNEGTVFKITPSGSVTILNSFDALNSDGTNFGGASPYAGVIEGHNGNLYGTTYAGGLYGCGTFFVISSSLGEWVTDFGQPSAVVGAYSAYGAYPLAGLFQGADGTLYGTTSAGGGPAGGSSGNGTVFEVRMPIPVISTVSPYPLPPAGTTVYLGGFNFTGTTGVMVGTRTVPSFTGYGDSGLSFIMPAGARSGMITVRNSFGKGTFGTTRRIATSSLVRNPYQAPAGGGLEPISATVENTSSQQIYVSDYTCTVSGAEFSYDMAGNAIATGVDLTDSIIAQLQLGYPGLPIAPQSVGFNGWVGTIAFPGQWDAPWTVPKNCTMHLYGYVGTNWSDKVDLGQLNFVANPYLPIISDIDKKVFYYSASRDQGLLTVGGKIWNSYNLNYTDPTIPAIPTLTGAVIVPTASITIVNSPLANGWGALPYGTIADFTSGMFTLGIPDGTPSFTATIVFGDLNVEDEAEGLATFTVVVGP